MKSDLIANDQPVQQAGTSVRHLTAFNFQDRDGDSISFVFKSFLQNLFAVELKLSASRATSSIKDRKCMLD